MTEIQGDGTMQLSHMIYTGLLKIKWNQEKIKMKSAVKNLQIIKTLKTECGFNNNILILRSSVSHSQYNEILIKILILSH